MLNLVLFASEFAILEGLFGKQFPDAVRDRYYQILASELDDEQFKAACIAIFKNETRFPTPHQFINAAPSLSQLIGAEMERLGISGALLEGFHAPDKRLVSELTQAETRQYLAYLRQKSAVRYVAAS